MAQSVEVPQVAQETLESDHPQELNQNWQGFNLADVLFSVAMFTLMITVSQLIRPLLSLLVIGFWFVCLRRTYDDRYYMAFLKGCKSVWIRYAKKNVIWRAEQPSRRFRLSRWLQSRHRIPLMGVIGKLLRPGPPVPLRVLNIDGRIGVVENLVHQTLSLIILGDGSPVTAMSLKGQYYSHQSLAESIKKIASLPGGSVGVSFVYLRRPADIWKIMNTYSRLLHPDVALPKETDEEQGLSDDDRRDHNIHQVLWEALAVLREEASDVTMAAVVTVRREGALAAAERGKKKLTEKEARRLVVRKVEEAALSELEGWGIDNPRVLSRDGVKDFLLRSWNVVDLEEHYKRMATEEAETEEQARVSRWHWPGQRILAFRDYCVTDNTYHAVLRVTRFPAAMLPNQPRLLHACPVPWLSVTAAGEIVSSSGELWRMKRFLRIRRELFSATGFDERDDPKARAADESLERRQERIFRSSFRQDFMVLLQVSAASKDELDDYVRDVESSVRLRGGTCRRVRGECRQVRAVISAAGGQHLL